MADARDPSRFLSVYCDEAGNSGANLLDADQPVYVVGGWVVPDNRAGAVERVIEALTQGFAGQELKGTRFLGRRRGQEAYPGLMRDIAGAGAWPVFAIFEKRFWIAGKVVEVLFDPTYNDASSWDFF